MRIGLGVAILPLLFAATCSAEEPSQAKRKSKPIFPSASEVLREACKIALDQDEQQNYWTERLLLHIGELQIQARDFDGALRSIRGSNYPHGRNMGLAQLAKALAREGNRERAFKVLGLVKFDLFSPQIYLEDSVQLKWIEHLVVSGNLDRADEAIGRMKWLPYHPDALQDLAIAYAKSREPERAMEFFKFAIHTASGLDDEFDRSEALCKIAEIQLMVGMPDAAKATINRLEQSVKEVKDPGKKVTALRQAGLVAAKAKDDLQARRFFKQAIEAQKLRKGEDANEALEDIALAQAVAGSIDDALKTASNFKQNQEEPLGDGGRDAALHADAVAKLMAQDEEGALRSALKVKHYKQYHDDALHMIAGHQITKGDLQKALATAKNIENPSEKAAAILRVAAAHAKAGDRKTAADIASRIELTESDDLPVLFERKRFDYRLPRTWGVRYDDHCYISGTVYGFSTQRATEVAAGAMALSLVLEQKPDQSYAILFDEINTGEIVQALARTHATLGDANEALTWAKKIGSRGKVKLDEIQWAVMRRVHALIGVAEGILER
jgi:tetratricopeptide (TPR) repeat protein